MSSVAEKLKGTTVFVGCGFAAKYLLGGGNFAVPLQWMLGLRQLGIDAIWLEFFPTTGSAANDARHIRAFEEKLTQEGLDGAYCLLHSNTTADPQELDAMKLTGLSKAQLEERLRGPNILLNLCNSIHPPLIERFEHRVFCDLDPGEVSYWMRRVEMGQSSHGTFYTIGLNLNSPDCTAPQAIVPWRTFYPLVSTQWYQPFPRPAPPRITTVAQWYWQYIEIDGAYPDLSKRAAFEPFLSLPSLVSGVEMELAANIATDDPERARLQNHGWRLKDPHQLMPGPREYRRYIAESLAEFSPGKRFHAMWRTGWFSDRAAAYLASGRPVITDDNGVSRYLPQDSGVLFANTLPEAAEAVRRVMNDWAHLSKQAVKTAVEYFDAARNLEKMLRGLA